MDTTKNNKTQELEKDSESSSSCSNEDSIESDAEKCGQHTFFKGTCNIILINK